MRLQIRPWPCLTLGKLLPCGPASVVPSPPPGLRSAASSSHTTRAHSWCAGTWRPGCLHLTPLQHRPWPSPWSSAPPILSSSPPCGVFALQWHRAAAVRQLAQIGLAPLSSPSAHGTRLLGTRHPDEGSLLRRLAVGMGIEVAGGSLTYGSAGVPGDGLDGLLTRVPEEDEFDFQPPGHFSGP